MSKNHWKCPHPQQSNWHQAMTPEEKEAHCKKISVGMKAFHAKRTKKQVELRKKRQSKSNKAFYASYKGREEAEYRQYVSKHYRKTIPTSKEEELSLKCSIGMKKYWDSITPEEKQIHMGKVIAKCNNIQYFMEIDVPREKDFCGVVQMEEELMYG